MKKKCDHCHGKGGWSRSTLRFNTYVTCPQCKGKGKWWPNQKPKAKRAKQ